MELRCEEESEKRDFGPEHNALVSDADQLLGVGKADEARDVVLRLRMRYPDSPHTRRVNERLKIAGGANEYWRKHDRGSDFHKIFWQAWGGASWGGVGALLYGAAFVLALLAALSLALGNAAGCVVPLALAGLLGWLGSRAMNRARQS